MSLKRTIGATLAVLLCLAPAPARADGGPGWAQSGYGPTGSRFNPDEHRLTAGRVHHLREAWSVAGRFDSEECVRRQAPVLAVGRLFAPDVAGVGAYDAATGRRLWTYRHATAGQRLDLAVDGDVLIVAASDCDWQSTKGGVFALDVATGSVRWRGDRDAAATSLVVDQGIAIVGGIGAGGIETTALRTASGRSAWSTRAWVTLGVAAGGTVLAAGYDSTAPSGALDVHTGRVRWTAAVFQFPATADPAGTSYLAQADGGLRRLDARTGRSLWFRKGDYLPWAAADRDRVYLATSSGGGKLTALDLRTGEHRWHRDLPEAISTVAGGVLWTAVLGKRIRALDPRTGAEFDAADAVEKIKPTDQVVVAGGRLYATDGRTLRAFKIR